MHLRRNQIEAWALQAVEVVLAGGRVEDDRVECKADWPDETKARQLAGHANAAGGEPILWLIGVDEKAHELTPPSPVDPADWWARTAKRFDEVAPEVLTVTVHVDHGRTVTALAFSTDQAPYVVTTGAEAGRAEREAPIRVSTRTRSTHRHELLRLLAPTITAPRVLPVSAKLTFIPQDANERLALRLSAEVFFEHAGGGPVMLPTYQMRARLDFDSRRLPSKLEPVHLSLTPPTYNDLPSEVRRTAWELSRFTGAGSFLPPEAFRAAAEISELMTRFGVKVHPDGLLLTGSGVETIRGDADVDDIPGAEELFGRVTAVQARCRFSAAGTDRPLEVSFMLHRDHHGTIWRSRQVEDPWGDEWGDEPSAFD